MPNSATPLTAYDMKRTLQIFGTQTLVSFMEASSPRQTSARSVLQSACCLASQLNATRPRAATNRLRFHTTFFGHRPVCQADFDVMPQRGAGCSLISGLVMQAEACGP
jgi:hypothetical protein